MRFVRVALLCLPPALMMTSCSGSSETDHSICVRIDNVFYYPTVPVSGYKVSRESAIEVDALLKSASLKALRSEAEPLQQAIDSNNEAGMVRAFTYLQDSVCPSAGVTPVT